MSLDNVLDQRGVKNAETYQAPHAEVARLQRLAAAVYAEALDWPEGPDRQAGERVAALIQRKALRLAS